MGILVNNIFRRGLQTEKREKEVLPRRASTRLAGGSVKEIERFSVLVLSWNVFLFFFAISTPILSRYNPVPEPEPRRSPEFDGKTLSLAEITSNSDASSLFASLATNEKGSNDSKEISKLTINPERVAKVTDKVEITLCANLNFLTGGA